MTELKPGWRRVKFGEVVRLSKERCSDPLAEGIERTIGLEHIEPADLRVRSWGNVAEGTTFTTRVRPGQVLFGKRRAYQRKVAVADFDAVCSGDIYVFESADPNHLLPELLPFLCQTEAFFDHAVGTSAGSLSPRTNWSSMADYEFFLPPMDEQRRIVAVASAMTAVREAQCEVVNSTGTLAESFCIDVVHSRPLAEQEQVGSLCKFTSGKSIAVTSLPQKPLPDADVPVYGGNGLAGFTAIPLTTALTPTVVVGRVGQFCGVTSLIRKPCWITDNALYPAIICDRLDMAYLALVLRGRHLNRGKLGEYLPLITQKVVHATHVPVPPLDEQVGLVKSLEEIEAASQLARERLKNVERLHGKMLNQFF